MFSPVTVIIPTLNEEDWLGEAIDSAFAAGAAEVIVADAASVDTTPRIATARQAPAGGAGAVRPPRRTPPRRRIPRDAVHGGLRPRGAHEAGAHPAAGRAHLRPALPPPRPDSHGGDQLDDHMEVSQGRGSGR